MRDDAHNSRPGGAPPANALADGVLVWPILSGQILVDHHDGLGALAVLVGEVPPFEQRDPHGFEISRRNRVQSAVRPGIAGAQRAAVNGEGRRWVESSKGKRRGNGGGRNSRQSGKLFFYGSIKGSLLFGIVVLSLWKLDRGCHQACGVKARVHLSHSREALQEQPRSHEQNKGQGYLPHRQPLPEALPPLAGAERSGFIFEDPGLPPAENSPDRNDAQKDAGQDAQRNNEEQNMPINPTMEARRKTSRREPEQGP